MLKVKHEHAEKIMQLEEETIKKCKKILYNKSPVILQELGVLKCDEAIITSIVKTLEIDMYARLEWAVQMSYQQTVWRMKDIRDQSRCVDDIEKIIVHIINAKISEQARKYIFNLIYLWELEAIKYKVKRTEILQPNDDCFETLLKQIKTNKE